ncbi:fatty acid desaturase [Marinobacter sp. TBZ242]|uniref:Fatty acid desaturase n=1 Tax=Marinobacter azerbaijanicus TaxID=3050455 RepID=A0ABT7IKM1_9GAMM|nr:fatty acid desaturase [Marinobacter sp. TBZ242]MDL0433634.1 fatty acid desaturase [Marinobacter sp. TBZ242]
MQANSSWPDARPALKQYRTPSLGKAIWQLINTLVPYAGLWYLMILSIRHDVSYLWTLALSVVAAAFLVRLFILFHDCVHGSLLPSTRANTWVGRLLGVLVFTPFDDWRLSHLRHHVSYANLDTRGFGDIWTLTLREYNELPRLKRWLYRLYRNPVVLLGFGAIFNFLLSNRLPSKKVQRKERKSVVFTNLAIVGVFLIAAQTIGWQTYLLIQLPVLWFAGMGGIWLFYVQHQFEGGYWARKGEWDALRAAMEGSSYYQLPTILRWFSANIGYHHIHHLNARIPNYRLPECYNEVSAVREKEPLTLRQSLHSFRLKLWDESQQKMVAFP